MKVEKPNIDNYTDSELEELIKELIEKRRNQKKDEPIYITAKEVATILNISENTVYIHARNGKIKSVKIGGSVRFDKNDLFYFISSMRSEVKYNNEAFCEKNYIISADGEMIVFKLFSIYRILRENKIWIYLYNGDFKHSVRIGKKEFRKYFKIADNTLIDTASFNLGAEMG